MLFFNTRKAFNGRARYVIRSHNGPTRRLLVTKALRTYNDAISHLNTLQTPYNILKAQWDAGIVTQLTALSEIQHRLKDIGYSQADLDKLNIVHVAGTKGKGTTCAYVDSILFQHQKTHSIPSKIGLYTSPHLIAVRERIKINSQPISPQKFAKYFFEVWDKLESASASSSTPFEKPVYFRFLTLMSYHAFIQENVDCAIYEVGIGGTYDTTNVVEHPAVTGISSLGIDHTFVLGDTIEKITAHKAGIMKTGAPAFATKQTPAARKVLRHVAEGKAVKLRILNENPMLEGVEIRPNARFQRLNATLAIALAETVLRKLDPGFDMPEKSLPKEFVDGLEQVVWRGRCEMKVVGNVSWFLDGAHTRDSIDLASHWFMDTSAPEKHTTRVLIFNQQGHRASMELLEQLHAAFATKKVVKFDHVIFCPTVPLASGLSKDQINHSTDTVAISGLTMQKDFAARWQQLDSTCTHAHAAQVQVLTSVEEALEFVKSLSKEGTTVDWKEENVKLHALVTGSVHLVGRTLGILEGPVDAL